MLNEIRRSLQVISALTPSEHFQIAAIYQTRLLFRPVALESPHLERFVVVQAKNSGVSFGLTEEDEADLSSLLGADCRYVSAGPLPLQIACLDAGYAALHRPPYVTRVVSGDLAPKAAARARIVAAEVFALLPCQETYVHCVGAVGSIIEVLRIGGAHVTVTDLDPQVVGTTLAGVYIEDGRELNDERIDSANLVLVTGMTLANGTFEGLMNRLRQSGKPVVVFAQSAANIFPHLLDCGISTVISEPYPFYLLPGDSTIDIYRTQSRDLSGSSQQHVSANRAA